MQATKFLNIDNNNLSIASLPLDLTTSAEPYIILSMCGTARVGKSTFINCLLSKIYNTNIHVVNTTSLASHCTLGVDCIKCNYVYNNQRINLLIFDTEGLMYEDSKCDDKLLSFIYLMSDIVVYHTSNIIDNQTLNSLTSLCLVADYVGKSQNVNETKPLMFFRIKDYNLESDPADVVKKTFGYHQDQYDNVRSAIQKLFPEIHTISTESLGKSQLGVLRENNFQKIYSTTDFDQALNTLLEHISHTQTNELKTLGYICNKASHIVTHINANTNISFSDYDYYTLLITKRFDDFWKVSIPECMYEKIEANETESVHKLCSERIKFVRKVIDEFTEVFSNVDVSLVHSQVAHIGELCLEKLIKTLDSCEKMGIEKIKQDNVLKTFVVQLFEQFEKGLCSPLVKNNYTYGVLYDKWLSHVGINTSTISSSAINAVFEEFYDVFEKRVFPWYEALIKTNCTDITVMKNAVWDKINLWLSKTLYEYIDGINDFGVGKSKHLEVFHSMVKDDVVKFINVQKLCSITYNIGLGLNMDETATFHIVESTVEKIPCFKSLFDLLTTNLDKTVIDYFNTNSDKIDSCFLKRFRVKYHKTPIEQHVMINSEFVFGKFNICASTIQYSHKELIDMMNHLLDKYFITTSRFETSTNNTAWINNIFLLSDLKLFIQHLCTLMSISEQKFHLHFKMRYSITDVWSINLDQGVISKGIFNKLSMVYMEDEN